MVLILGWFGFARRPGGRSSIVASRRREAYIELMVPTRMVRVHNLLWGA